MSKESPQHAKEQRSKSYLIIGDGDLSFSAAIAHDMADQGTNLIASVLESEEQHRAGADLLAIDPFYRYTALM
jgi:hypothetical protein